MATPTLPREDDDPEARCRGLDEDRETYRFDHSTAGFAFAAEVPRSDRFDARYIAQVIKNKLELASNLAASRLSSWVEDEWDEARERLRKRFDDIGDEGEDEALEAALADADGERQGRVDAQHPLSLDDYRDMHPILADPRSMPLWREDWYFAWQRIAGCNPALIQRVTELPDHFPVTQAHLRGGLAEDSLDAARAEGRLYMVDHAILDGVPAGETDGRPKYLDAPMSLFIRGEGGLLAPVAIQRSQVPGDDNPIYTPDQGAAWDMAKLVVQIADANHQGVISHFGQCHLVMEAVILSTRRQLAAAHPLRVLLEPHFEYTLAVNQVARTQLINPGGNMDRLQSGTLEGSHALVRKGLDAWPIHAIDAPTDFARRGVDDLEGLPEYPFRDDALSSWVAILDFVRSYVALYYAADGEVVADVELQAWLRELEDPKAGQLNAVAPGGLGTVEGLVMVIARFVYLCTTYHASINYSSWDFLGFVPNMPAGGWGPGPRPGHASDEAALLAMMTPLDTSFETIDLMHSISVQHNQLGDYPRGHFDDERVEPLVARFRHDLDVADQAIMARNLRRPIPYPYLLPSNITASIHV